MNKNDNWYESIGRFVVEFSILTHTLWVCIKKLIESNKSLLEKLNNDKKIQEKTKSKFIFTEWSIADLHLSLMHLLTTWEICKIFKTIFIEQYIDNPPFLKVLDLLFEDIDEFCSYDWYRNDLMHGWLFIDEAEPYSIIIHRMTLVNWALVLKDISLDLDELNLNLRALSIKLYKFSEILDSNDKIEQYMQIENWKIVFSKVALLLIEKKVKL